MINATAQAYSYFPGCSLTATNRAYDISTRSVADVLGVGLVELDDWNCCGATAYMAVNGEVDAGRIIATAWLRKKRIFLPVMACSRLKFSELKMGSEIRPNPFGILEPVYKKHELTPPGSLELVLVPLVAFDANLNRVGMGGGYYDRAFAFAKKRKKWRKPLLVGLAYSFQQVEKIFAASPSLISFYKSSKKKTYSQVKTKEGKGNP